jgi:hypothetical protein
MCIQTLRTARGICSLRCSNQRGYQYVESHSGVLIVCNRTNKLCRRRRTTLLEIDGRSNDDNICIGFDGIVWIRERSCKPNPTGGCCPKLRMHADGRDGLCTMRTEPSPHHARGPWDNTPGNLPILKWKDDSAVNGHGEAAVSPSEHD